MTFSIPDCFMIAFLVGLVFGLVYEVFRIIRLVLRFKAAVFVCDMAFFVLSAFAVCALSKFLGNYIRIYTILGFGAGVFTYIVTIGRLLNLAESAASIAWRYTIGRALHAIGKGLKCIFTKLLQTTKGIFVKIDKYFKKASQNRSEHLKSSGKKLYNNSNRTDGFNGDNTIGENKNNVIKAKVRKIT